ncbi:MAG: zf-HC2 domain-containing protein, partial [Bryobacteraceae bacterium]
MAELAEAFVMDRLNAIDTERVEQHLLMCDGCREAVEAADNVLNLI